MAESFKILDLERLKNFPISFFAVGLGLIGFTLAWQKAEEIFLLPFSFSGYFLYFSIVVIFAIFFIYLSKVFKYPNEVKKEFNHPIKINFFPIIGKLFLIASVIYLSLNIGASKYLWWIGVIIQFISTILIMSAWIRKDFDIKHINPSWFIPVVGSVIIPIAGVKHFSPELSWFFFSIGFFWWFILTTLVMNRVIFHHPIPDKLIPTFFILFAPPIIGFIAITKLIGPNPFGSMLYYFGLFMFILILFQWKIFAKIKFYLSWWAYSFPMDALVIGNILMYHQTNLLFFKIISLATFLLLNMIILFLIVKTAIAVKNKRICIQEED